MGTITGIDQADKGNANGMLVQAITLIKEDKFTEAAARIRSGRALFPDMSLDGESVWAMASAKIGERLTALGLPIPVSGAPVSAVPVSASPAPVSVSVPPAAVAPVSAPSAPISMPPVDDAEDRQPGAGAAFGEAHRTVTINHTPLKGTWVSGTEKGDGTWDVMTSSGQRWSYNRVQKVYYLGRSAGYAADLVRIGWAALALRRAGFSVVYEIDDSAAPVKKISAAARNRHYECQFAARRQQRVTAGVGSDEPVSAAPAQVAAAPAPVAPVSVAPVPVRPVSAQPVSVPRPPVSAPPIIALPDYVSMSDDLLLAAMLSGELSAVAEVRARMSRNAAAVVAPVSAAPAQTVADVRPVYAPPAVELPEHVLVNEQTAEYWLACELRGGAMKTAAYELRQKINRMVTSRFGERGDRPQVSVYRARKAIALCVRLTYAPDGVDVRELIGKTLEASTRVVGVGSVREPVQQDA
jgi:hypothetical protein